MKMPDIKENLFENNGKEDKSEWYRESDSNENGKLVNNIIMNKFN